MNNIGYLACRTMSSRIQDEIIVVLSGDVRRKVSDKIMGLVIKNMVFNGTRDKFRRIHDSIRVGMTNKI